MLPYTNILVISYGCILHHFQQCFNNTDLWQVADTQNHQPVESH
jgi:hypothetical protein